MTNPLQPPTSEVEYEAVGLQDLGGQQAGVIQLAAEKAALKCQLRQLDADFAVRPTALPPPSVRPILLSIVLPLLVSEGTGQPKLGSTFGPELWAEFLCSVVASRSALAHKFQSKAGVTLAFAA